MASAATLQEEGEPERGVPRHSPTPIDSKSRPSSLDWTGLPTSSKPPASPVPAPLKLHWDNWSAELEAGPKAQVRDGLAPEQKQSMGSVKSGRRDSDASPQSRTYETTTKVWSHTDQPGRSTLSDLLTFGKVESNQNSGGWAKYAAPKKLVQNEELPQEKRWTLKQPLYRAVIPNERKSMAHGAGRWKCSTCKSSVDDRATHCHYCRKPREYPMNETSRNHMQGNGEPGEQSSDVDETDIAAASHWKHVRQRSEYAGIGKIGDLKDDGIGDQENPADGLAQEREERLRASSNGAYVGLKGGQDTNSNGTQDGPAQRSSSAIRYAMSAPKSPVREVVTSELPSQPKEFLSRRIHASTSNSDDWKAWKPPAQRPMDSTQQPPEMAEGPRIKYQHFRLAPDMNESRVRLVNTDDSLRQTAWNTATPNPLEQGTHEFTEHRSAKQSDSGALARKITTLDTSVDRSRVAKRNNSRRQQQRAADFDDEDESVLARIERKRQRKRDRSVQSLMGPPTPIILPEFISVGNLATVLRVRIEDFVSRMKSLGFEETNNDHVLDAETAGLIAAEFNFEPVNDRSNEVVDLMALPSPEDKSFLLQRPPVITIMGHVDHGKTTLLDYLRKSSVAASEHGGITQHIGAFTVPMPSGQIVTFLDTPGHAAFLSMRQRGANVTDIVILVVAADDSVKPQTIEAINHAKAANVPMIVAINKIDKPDADVTRVKQDLARHNVEVEDFGGDTQVVCVSGKTGQGMEELEDAAVALADVLDLRAETDGQAEGWILEATTKKGGRVATVLVRRGTIVPGSVVVAGTTWARVRSLRNEAGQSIPSAGPGTPVEVDGWREQPEAGDEVLQAPNEQRAKDVVQLRLSRREKEKLAADVAAVNEARRLEQEKRERQEAAAKATEAGEPEPAVVAHEPTRVTEIPFIVRGDVSGSVEAVVDSISSLGNSDVRPIILRSSVGPISPTDVEHAAAAKGHIISFNTPIEGSIRRMAEAVGVSILDQNIIYRLVDDVKTKLESALPELVTTRVTGEAEIAQVFEINVKGRVTVPVAGCRVRNGVIGRTAKVRVVRGGAVVYTGMCSSLFVGWMGGSNLGGLQIANRFLFA